MNRKRIVSAIAVLLAVLMVASLVFSVIPAAAYAASLDEIKQQKNELSSQVTQCQERLEALKEQQANALDQKAALDEQNRLANEQLALIAEEIDSYTKLIEEKAKEVEKAKNKEADQLERYRVRVRAMEENGSLNILSLIVKSDNFADLLTAMDDMGEIMQSDRVLQEQYVEAREETEEIKAEYEAEKAGYEEDQAKLKTEQAEIGRQIQEATKLLESLEKDIQKALQEYKAAEAAEDAAAATIADMILQYNKEKAAAQAAAKAEAAAAAAKAEEMAKANADAAASGQEPPYSEDEMQKANDAAGYDQVDSGSSGYVWPVPCSTRITSRFGYRSDPFTGEQRYHSGIDIDGFGNDGGAIVAAAAGTVITASFDSGYGNYVIVDHGSTQTLYAHMSGIAVSVGASVAQGQTVGYLGATGRATGTHCHFEVFVGGERVDPAQYFSGMTYYNC